MRREAAGTAVLGRRLIGPLGGLLAGAMYGMMPIVGFTRVWLGST